MRMLEQKNDELEQAVRAAKFNAEHLQEQLDAQAEENVFLKGDLEELRQDHQEQMRVLESELKDTKEELEVARVKHERTAGEIPAAPFREPKPLPAAPMHASDGAAERISELETENEELQAEMQGLEESIDEISEEMEKMTEELQTKAARVSALENEIMQVKRIPRDSSRSLKQSLMRLTPTLKRLSSTTLHSRQNLKTEVPWLPNLRIS